LSARKVRALKCNVTTPIEFAPHFRPRPIRHVLMDWDGTTALSRAGWGEVMTDVYVENLPPLAGETSPALRAFAWDELMRLNGKPAIHQMAHLADLIRARGGEPLDALDYQNEFQRRLGELVAARLDAVRSGAATADALLVPGVRLLFAELRARGLACSLASGTPIAQLTAEAALLDVAAYFDGRIFGPDDTEDRRFSKTAVIAGLLADHALDGAALMAFGDGPAEIVATKAVGGLAIAVASDEVHPGRVDEFKRATLLAAGADAVIADFREAAALLAALGAA
jgi:phosphoglycolate phosphatase